MALVTVALPPLQANSGRWNEPNRSMSWMRPERIGPTGSLPWLWKTIAKRVRLSLTISSYTMSAALKPVCGRAAGALSILTTSAGRAGALSPSASGTPVSGIRGTTSSVVVVGAAVVVGASVVDVVVVVCRVVVGASVVSGTVASVVVGLASSAAGAGRGDGDQAADQQRPRQADGVCVVGRVRVIVLSTG